MCAASQGLTLSCSGMWFASRAALRNELGSVSPEDVRSRTSAAFDEFDRDGSGQIDASELSLALKRLGVQASVLALCLLVCVGVLERGERARARERERWRETERGIETGRQGQTDRQTDRQGQTDRQTDRQRDRQTDRPTDRDRDSKGEMK